MFSYQGEDGLSGIRRRARRFPALTTGRAYYRPAAVVAPEPKTYASAGGGTTTSLPIYSGRGKFRAVRDEYGNFIGWNQLGDDGLSLLRTTNVQQGGPSRFEQITGLIGRGLDIYQQRRQAPPGLTPVAPVGGGFGAPSASIGLSTATGLQGGLNISPTTLILGAVGIFLLLKKK